MKSASLVVLLLGALMPVLGMAQMSEDEYRQCANSALEKLGVQVSERPTVDIPEPQNVPTTGLKRGYWPISVNYGKCLVGLNGYTGDLVSCVLPHDLTPGKNMTDDEARQQAAELAAKFMETRDLVDVTVRRRVQNGVETIFVFAHPRPYGFPTSVGNGYHVFFTAANGTMTLFGMTMGWTYERPDIRFSPDQAFQIANMASGGTRNWVIKSEYRGHVPPGGGGLESQRQLASEHKLRLCYSLGEVTADGASGWWVLMDTVTGEVLCSITPNGAMRVGGKPRAAARKMEDARAPEAAKPLPNRVQAPL